MITTGTFPKALVGKKEGKKVAKKESKKESKEVKKVPQAGLVSPRKQLAMGGKCPK